MRGGWRHYRDGKIGARCRGRIVNHGATFAQAKVGARAARWGRALLRYLEKEGGVNSYATDIGGKTVAGLCLARL